MATPRSRLRISPRDRSGGGFDWGQLFSNVGGGSVEPVEPGDVPYTDPTFDARTQVRFKPEHPVLNALSGGRGTALANQLNTEQILGAAQDAQETAVQKERLANESAIRLKGLATEKYINVTGITPEQDPDLYSQFVKGYSHRLMGLTEAETAEKTETEKTRGILAKQEGQVAESTFPFRQIAANLKALGEKYAANTAATAARGEFGRQASVESGKDIALQQQLANQPYQNLLAQIEAGIKIMPHGTYDVLGRKFTLFPTSQLETTPQFKSQFGIQDQVGRIVGFDPQLGRAIIEKPSAAVVPQQQTAPSGVTVKPIDNTLQTDVPSAPSTSLNLPTGRIAGAIGTGLASQAGSNIIDYLNALRMKAKGVLLKNFGQYDPLLDTYY